MSSAKPPSGLICDLMSEPQKTVTNNSRPYFGWVFEEGNASEGQTACQLQVFSVDQADEIADGQPLWDSGKLESARLLNVAYGGSELEDEATCAWRVRTWNGAGDESEWSSFQYFHTGDLCREYTTPAYPLETEEIAPVVTKRKGEGHYFFDFGRAAFGRIRLGSQFVSSERDIDCHLGEKLQASQEIDRSPPGNVRYRCVPFTLRPGAHDNEVKIPPNSRNTRSRTIRMPEEVGEVLPFQYCEIENCPPEFNPGAIRQVAVHYPFDDDAAQFSCSNELLNDIWDLCKHTIKATTFCGLYVDGDRERFPREGDAYINQLGHYCVDREFTMARRTHEFMITHTSQWTEWILQSVFMAWEDYMYTGDLRSVEVWYDDLKAKTLVDLARAEGLISTRTGLVTDELRKRLHYYEGEHVRGEDLRDIVDWPPGGFRDDEPGERDGFDFRDINTVVNAFHYRALVLMSRLAEATEHVEDADFFSRRASRIERVFDQKLFDGEAGRYVDGEGSDHASLHANLFPLAFGLVPPDRIPGVLDHIRSRGMACSVYGAQHLLDALYRTGAEDYALELLTSTDDRSWGHMVEEGATMTWEAWDWKYKKNLDWNHPWGAAPANLIPRRLMGVRPLRPGFGKVLIQPQPGDLTSAECRVPTIRGPIDVRLENAEDVFKMEVHIPVNTAARAELPAGQGEISRVEIDGVEQVCYRKGKYIVIDPLPPGAHFIELKRS